MRKFLFFTIMMLCLTGCRLYDVDEILLQRQEISLTIKGKEILVYEPETFQTGYNDRKNEFRVFEDDLGNWFTLTCRERPSTEGQTLKADLKWTGSNTTSTRTNLTFSVERTDANGYVWMWCEDEAIGIIVREF
jgi:hypothetical protein